jgi:hypothetical protein
MSFLDKPISSFFSLGANRAIGEIRGYITITESTTDSLEITQQPVQRGAMIADHSFLKPVTFSAQIQFAPGILGNIADLYQDLIDLQATRQPFTITTPTRIYKNMLFQTLTKVTDKKTENVLAINASFTQILIVSVSVGLIPRIVQKNPGATGGTEQAGRKSALLTLKQGIGAAFQ